MEQLPPPVVEDVVTVSVYIDYVKYYTLNYMQFYALTLAIYAFRIQILAIGHNIES